MFVLNALASLMIVGILAMLFYGTVRVILWDVSQRMTLAVVLTCLFALIGILGSCFGASAAPAGLIQALLVCLFTAPWMLVFWRADVRNNSFLRVRVLH